MNDFISNTYAYYHYKALGYKTMLFGDGQIVMVKDDHQITILRNGRVI
jgi:hypothetical protein